MVKPKRLIRIWVRPPMRTLEVNFTRGDQALLCRVRENVTSVRERVFASQTRISPTSRTSSPTGLTLAYIARIRWSEELSVKSQEHSSLSRSSAQPAFIGELTDWDFMAENVCSVKYHWGPCRTVLLRYFPPPSFAPKYVPALIAFAENESWSDLRRLWERQTHVTSPSVHFVFCLSNTADRSHGWTSVHFASAQLNYASHHDSSSTTRGAITFVNVYHYCRQTVRGEQTAAPVLI